MVKSLGQPSRDVHSASWRHALPKTNAPILPISPYNSAKGMKSLGGTTPRSGWRQRTSASTPTSNCVSSENSGW